ncbi:MAG: Mur ligase family protein [Myxococcota bacterium]|nr:Mur ligase family protein [Myxococcota bacterium]
MRIETVHRITGAHLLLDGPGAAIWFQEVTSEKANEFLDRAQRASEYFRWGQPFLYRHQRGFAIALEVPVDQLYAACTLLEWSCSEEIWGESVEERIRQEEAENPSWRLLRKHLMEQKIPFVEDEDGMTIGLGKHSQTWSLNDLPHPTSISRAHSIPTIYITGTNGKTTTTRMLSFIAQSAGFYPGMTSSDGVVVNGKTVVEGDWTGTGAARRVLRHRNVDFAILETARGGLMRRGVSYAFADVAGISNVSPDHYGRWGLNSVSEMAKAKLSIVKGVKRGGTLVLNLDDSILYETFQREYPDRKDIEVLFFSLSPHPLASIYLDGKTIFLHRKPLCTVQDIPLSLGGAALYNIQNAMLASLLAYKQGIDVEAIKTGLGLMKPTPTDSRGRTNLFRYRDATVLVDFAHNEGGLNALVQTAQRMKSSRCFLIYGQAGDRDEELLRGLNIAAASLNADRYFVKALPKHSYGKDPKAVVSFLVNDLVLNGIEPDRIETFENEMDSVHAALRTLREGDLLLLLTHEAYEDVVVIMQEEQD